MATRRMPGRLFAVIGLVAITGSACKAGVDVNTLLERLSAARQSAADLHIQFTKAADAANRAVMADTDETSVAFAREAEQANQMVQHDIDTLGPLLESLDYPNERGLLGNFVSQFAQYRALDQRILDLAVENTNVKAQQLAFGPAQEAADAFRDALKDVAASVPTKDAWHVEALAARATATVREIQLLQAPHIANADEAVMTRMEKEMATSETAARTALEQLAPLVPPASRPRLAAAKTTFDQFMSLNAEIIALSRRNTNVRSLALSLDQKRTLTAACEGSLRALEDALATRGFTGTRNRP